MFQLDLIKLTDAALENKSNKRDFAKVLYNNKVRFYVRNDENSGLTCQELSKEEAKLIIISNKSVLFNEAPLHCILPKSINDLYIDKNSLKKISKIKRPKKKELSTWGKKDIKILNYLNQFLSENRNNDKIFKDMRNDILNFEYTATAFIEDYRPELEEIGRGTSHKTLVRKISDWSKSGQIQIRKRRKSLNKNK